MIGRDDAVQGDGISPQDVVEDDVNFDDTDEQLEAPTPRIFQIIANEQPNPKQVEFYEARAAHVGFGGSMGGGKMLRLDEPVPTPQGWTTIGEIQAGDYIFGADGKPVRVAEVYAVETPKESYCLTFDDRAEIEACADHLWATLTKKDREAAAHRTEEFRAARRAKRPSKAGSNKTERFRAAISACNSRRKYEYLKPPRESIRTTKEIADSLTTKYGEANHAMPVAGALRLPDADLALAPYLLGVWLGDGSTDSGSITTKDAEIIDAFVQEGFSLGKHRPKSGTAAWSQTILGLVPILREVGVFGNKHIPTKYLRASIPQRLALLQGLMDTDGTVSHNGAAEFCTTSKALADGVYELVCSLGWKVRINEGRAKLYGKDCGAKWTLKWRPDEYVFRLQRKHEKQVLSKGWYTNRRYVKSARRVPGVPMRCIRVDSDDGLFLVGKAMLVTHNSHAARRKAAMLCIKHDGLKVLLLRRTFRELNNTHIVPLRADLYGYAKYNVTESVFIFPNGSRLQMGYCDNDADVEQYMSQEYEVIIMEEATQFTEYQRTKLTTRNRTTRSDFTPRMYYLTNPGGVGHDWFKRLFIDRDYREGENPDDYLFIPASLYDNHALMKNDPGYEKKLLALPEDQRKAYLYGDWNVFSGQYFSEFRKDVHVIKPMVPPAHWRRYFTMDYGLDMLAGYWIAVDENGQAFVYRELYQSDLSVSQAAKAIIAAEGDDKIYDRMAPPDLFARNDQTGRSPIEIFSDHGLYFTRAKNERVQGWLDLKEWLAVYEAGKNEDGSVIFDSNLKICSNCTNLIESLPKLQHKDPGSGDPNDVESKKQHKYTHAPDAIRYWVAGRPRAAMIEVSRKRAIWEPDMYEDYDNADEAGKRVLLDRWGNPF